MKLSKTFPEMTEEDWERRDLGDRVRSLRFEIEKFDYRGDTDHEKRARYMAAYKALSIQEGFPVGGVVIRPAGIILGENLPATCGSIKIKKDEIPTLQKLGIIGEEENNGSNEYSWPFLPQSEWNMDFRS